MNIDLNKVNKIVISHGHDDHTGGLKYFFKEKKDIELITHPECFNYKEVDNLCISSPLTKEDISKLCNLNLTNKPLKISNNITYLGEIPKSNDFEKSSPIGKTIIDGISKDDLVEEDSAIVYKSDKGLFVITGCSHSGICNIIEYAKKVCDDDRIYGVIGGFHLFENDERLQNTIKYFKENNIELLYPCHCVSLEAKIEIAKQMKINEVGVGLELDI
jgi:7,8-dihydropterin-6-yl-methyl-4-(beta-D-ribofuranosyl)aminobenzene 5'-phosphate synthase